MNDLATVLVASIAGAALALSLRDALAGRRRRPLVSPSGTYPALRSPLPPEPPTEEPPHRRITASEAPTVAMHSCVDALEPAPRCVTCNRPWAKTLPAVLSSLVLLVGCGTERKQSEQRQERRETVTVERTRTERSTLAPDGTPFVEVTVTTRTQEETSRSEARAEITGTTSLRAPEISTAVAAVAAGGGIAIPGAPVLGAIFMAATTAWAAHKNAQAAAERKRADEWKRDADEGWAKADERALQLPPTKPKES